MMGALLSFRRSTMRLNCRVLLFTWITVLAAVSASAQEAPLKTVLEDLFADITLQPPITGQSHEAHFLPSESGDLASLVFSRAVTSQLSGVPVGTSAGAFTYTFDASLGTFSRSSRSYGPSLAERAVTLGKGKGSVGFTYQQSKFQTFEGKDLESGDIVFYLRHDDLPPDLFFEGDLIQERVALDLSTRTFTLFGSYGITDWIDVGVVIPISSVDLEASLDQRVLRLATGDTGPNASIHLFPVNQPSRIVEASASATGIGDVLMRSKFRLFNVGGGAVAAGLDVRLPTGDEDELLGTGTTQVRVLGIVSRDVGLFSPHANIGFTAGDTDVAANELSYAVGTEFTPVTPLTFSVDLLGRRVLEVSRFEERDVTHSFRSSTNVPGTFTYSEFAPVEGSLNVGSGVFGVKYNPARTFVVTFNLVVPFTDSGLTPGVTPIVGFDYSF
jgi:hypothetical protein